MTAYVAWEPYLLHQHYFPRALPNLARAYFLKPLLASSVIRATAFVRTPLSMAASNDMPSIS